MTNNDKSGNPTKKTAKQIEKIEEMYRQADQLYDGFAESEFSSEGPLDPTIHRRPDGPENGDFGTASPDDSYDPTWILGVLEDLSNFAEDENLSDLEDYLRDAHRRVAKIIAAMDTR